MQATIYTAMQGDNADLFAQILQLYFKPGAKLIDTTHGRGGFWKKVDTGLYNLTKCDTQLGHDATALPAELHTQDFDGVIFDPPYTHDSATYKGADYFNQACKRTQRSGHRGVVNFYVDAACESRKLLKKGGIWVAKTQDEICSGRYRSTSDEITRAIYDMGFRKEDEFALLQKSTPSSARWKNKPQKHARKNHSVCLVYRYLPLIKGRRKTERSVLA